MTTNPVVTCPSCGLTSDEPGGVYLNLTEPNNFDWGCGCGKFFNGPNTGCLACGYAYDVHQEWNENQLCPKCGSPDLCMLTYEQDPIA